MSLMCESLGFFAMVRIIGGEFMGCFFSFWYSVLVRLKWKLLM